jgi:ubiquinone biosynthesis protein COQ4
MGYMDLMSKAENIHLLGELVKNFVEGHHKGLDNVYDLEDGFHKTIWMEGSIRKLKEDPECAKIIEERYMGPEYDLDKLSKLPKDTLGYTYAKIMTAMGFQPHFYRDRPSLNDESDYVTMRVRKTHDIHHALSGFDMNVGEIGVIAINVSQFGYPAFMLLDLVGLTMACFPTMSKVPENEKFLGGLVFDTLSAGIKMGREAKRLFPVRFEEMLDRPLQEVRKQLNITPIRDGPSWYHYPGLKDSGLS